MTDLPPRLIVGMDSWMVLFGVLPDVTVGDRVNFAVSALPLLVAPLVGAEPRVEHLALSYYRLTARLVEGVGGSQFIETPRGLFHLGMDILPRHWVGLIISGEFELLVDAGAIDAPRPMSPWKVHALTRQTPNWRDRRTEENRPISPGKRLLSFARFLTSPGLRFAGTPAPRTNAFSDDSGLAHYNLEVEPLPGGTE